jgi:hypothetical protein
MSKQGIVKGLLKLDFCSNMMCGGCQFGKAHRLPFQYSKFESNAPLELVHIDVFGKVKNSSINGKRCMITLINDFLRYLWVYFMKENFETLKKYKEFCVESELLVKRSICCLQIDNGREYTSDEFNKYLKKLKIQRQLTCWLVACLWPQYLKDLLVVVSSIQLRLVDDIMFDVMEEFSTTRMWLKLECRWSLRNWSLSQRKNLTP